ncbi:MAG: hypothetical protein U0792_18460 [Gemmataceae bacterium]
MTLIAFTIPDDPLAVPAWLEVRLLSPNFGAFIAELEATYPDYGTRTTLRKLLENWYRPAIAEGLADVPHEFIRKLLRHPKCLLELQELVLTEGGPHWDDVAAGVNDFDEAVSRGQATLDAILEPPVARGRSSEVNTLAEPSTTTEQRKPSSERLYRRWAIVSSALAACLLVAVGVVTYQNRQPGIGKQAGFAWGWDRVGGIPPVESKPTEYLNGLAKSSEEWFDARPTGAPEVARRINELRAGCTKLILSPHTPLAPTDQEWLKAKCREWAGKFDASLAALEAGADPVQVREQVDETVHQLAKALRQRLGQST